MSLAESPLWTKTVAVGILVVASVVGNVSLSASQLDSGATAVGAASSPPGRKAPFPAPPVAPAIRLSGTGYASTGASAMGTGVATMPPLSTGVPENSDSSDAGEVVPAIYAWDPDVRFVFYRRISKWM